MSEDPALLDAMQLLAQATNAEEDQTLWYTTPRTILTETIDDPLQSTSANHDDVYSSAAVPNTAASLDVGRSHTRRTNTSGSASRRGSLNRPPKGRSMRTITLGDLRPEIDGLRTRLSTEIITKLGLMSGLGSVSTADCERALTIREAFKDVFETITDGLIKQYEDLKAPDSTELACRTSFADLKVDHRDGETRISAVIKVEILPNQSLHGSSLIHDEWSLNARESGGRWTCQKTLKSVLE